MVIDNKEKSVPLSNQQDNRKYIIKAMYDCISDIGMTPCVKIDTNCEGIKLPSYFEHGKNIILNISKGATNDLKFNYKTGMITCSMAFSNKIAKVQIPIASVIMIYARESMLGMDFARCDSNDYPNEYSESGIIPLMLIRNDSKKKRKRFTKEEINNMNLVLIQCCEKESD